jgi:hypothetical protein
LLLHPHADRIRLALVARVLLRDSFRHWLHTFKPAGRIEVGALFAGMQLKSALRALPQRLGDQSQQRPTLSATGDRVRPRHLHRARTKRVLADRLLAHGRLLALASAVLISVLAIFKCFARRRRQG